MSQELSFKKATTSELDTIISMYRKSFKQLYEKYLDEDTNPYKESKDLIKHKMLLPNSDYFFILNQNKPIGVIRILTDPKKDEGKISPILILPNWQNQKLAQKTMLDIEKKFSQVKTWYLDTIKQEAKLVHLYLKVGYKIIPKKQKHIKNGMDLVYFIKKFPN